MKAKKVFPKIFVREFVFHVVVEMIGGAFGIVFGKWVFEMISGRVEEMSVSFAVVSFLVKSIFSVVFKWKSEDDKFP